MCTDNFLFKSSGDLLAAMKIILGVFLCFIVAVYSGAPKVVGGKEAPDGKYPYMVSIRNESDVHLCGGSIINKRWILTAAHCVERHINEVMTIVVGTNMRKGDDGQRYQSEYLVANPEYNKPARISNDVGLIRVNKDIVFNNKVKPIKLPTTDVYKVGLPAVVSGWGRLWFEGPKADKLQEISLRIFDQDTCKKDMIHITEINHSHICTFTKYGEGVCHGDSGSPLVADGVQVGIASFVQPCAIGYPDVWARVYHFLDWIAAEQAKF